MIAYRPMLDVERYIAEALSRVHLAPSVRSFIQKLARLAAGPEQHRQITNDQAGFLCDIALRNRSVPPDIVASARSHKIRLEANPPKPAPAPPPIVIDPSDPEQAALARAAASLDPELAVKGQDA
jgi:hypothetical protein